MNNTIQTPPPEVLGSPSGSPSSETPETDAAFKDIYKPPYRVGLGRLAKLLMFVRGLEKARNHNHVCIERLAAERLMLAKLAAKEPQFFNPLVAMEAETLRDRILSENVRWRVHEANVQLAVRESAARMSLGVITPHHLRHAYGTHALEMGNSIKAIQNAMGHASMETTAGYLHADGLGVRSPLEVMA